MQKGASSVSCIPVTDSVDCALKLLRNEADFAIFSAEESMLVSKFVNDSFRVLGELRHRDHINESHAFQTVVLVRESFTGGFVGLQNTNYCHPGFGDGQFWSDSVLKEFEKAVIKRSCLDEKSSAEQEIYSLANFFKSACRPGQWALDDLQNKKLKKKYSSLCSLCDSPNRCAYNENQQGSHEKALACLTNRGGDVAYVALEFVKKYFGLIPSYESKARSDEYKFLCNDGLYRPLSSPCPWVKQPWPAVVTLKSKAPNITTLLPTWLCNETSPECRKTWKEAFTLLFEDSYTNSYVQHSDKDFLTLDEYLQKGRNFPRDSDSDLCQKNVRWCTTSPAEDQKCEWLKQAVIVEDIEPRLNCVPSTDIGRCFDLIQKRNADVMGIDSDYLFLAKGAFNLTTAVYLETSLQQNYLILAIVRAGSNITSIASLKGKKACFPIYNGLAWNAFISVAKKESLLPSLYPHSKAVSAFFSEVCTPGIRDSINKQSNITVPQNLYSLCINKSNETKNETEFINNDKYFGDLGAFSCLGDMASDVTFVNYPNIISKNQDLLKNITQAKYNILCPNGTRLPLLKITDVPDYCAFSSGVAAEIISRASAKKYEVRDITELLLKMNDRFGEFVFGVENIMRIYGPFDNKLGLMFKESTVDLIPVHDQANIYVSALTELENTAFEKSIEKSSSDTRVISSISLALLSFVFYITTWL